MKLGLVACGALIAACGSIPNDPPPDPDPVCTIQTTVESCGPTCTKCPTSDRASATCNAGTCGFVCPPAVPTCADASCSKLDWTFGAGSLEGVTGEGVGAPTPVVRDRGGNPALAIDVTALQNREVAIRLPVCLTSTLSLQTRRLQATVYLDGASDPGLQFYVQGAVPAPMTGAYLQTLEIAGRTATRYDMPISQSQLAGEANAAVIRVGSLGAAFSGTVYIDDIAIR